MSHNQHKRCVKLLENVVHFEIIWLNVFLSFLCMRRLFSSDNMNENSTMKEMFKSPETIAMTRVPKVTGGIRKAPSARQIYVTLPQL